VAEGKRLTVSLELSHDESYPFRSSLKRIYMLHSKYDQTQVAAVMHDVHRCCLHVLSQVTYLLLRGRTRIAT
jgi:hypothetical protein